MKLADVIAAWLTKAAGKAVDLRALLVQVGTALPDLKPECDALIAALDAPADVAGVVTATIPELGNIVLFKFDGREHASGGF